jgi:hypothetical protein
MLARPLRDTLGGATKSGALDATIGIFNCLLCVPECIQVDIYMLPRDPKRREDVCQDAQQTTHYVITPG